MIDRSAALHITQLASWFPVVSVTGPRQSGKSTLVKNVFPNHTHINLEDDSIFQRVKASPIDFLREHSEDLIIDEAQRIPELFRALQVVSDET